MKPSRKGMPPFHHPLSLFLASPNSRMRSRNTTTSYQLRPNTYAKHLFDINFYFDIHIIPKISSYNITFISDYVPIPNWLFPLWCLGRWLNSGPARWLSPSISLSLISSVLFCSRGICCWSSPLISTPILVPSARYFSPHHFCINNLVEVVGWWVRLFHSWVWTAMTFPAGSFVNKRHRGSRLIYCEGHILSSYFSIFCIL